MNKEMLRAVMLMNGDTYEDLAKVLKITKQSVCAKINENGTEFKQGEIALIRDRYNLSPEKVTAIFFN